MRLLSFTFDSNCIFNFKKCLFKYKGREFVLIPGDDKLCDNLQTIMEKEKEWPEIFKTINEFLFCFGWANSCSFKVKGDSSFPLQVGLFNTESLYIENRHYRNKKINDFSSIIEVKTEELEIALSLFNEANYTNDDFYKFLCLWKILEIRYPNRKTKTAVDWINQILNNNVNIYVHDYIKDLQSRNIDVGKHFKEKFRSSIVHITKPPIKISFKQEDFRDTKKACYSIDSFVRYFIKKELNLPKYCSKINVIKILK